MPRRGKQPKTLARERMPWAYLSMGAFALHAECGHEDISIKHGPTTVATFWPRENPAALLNLIRGLTARYNEVVRILNAEAATIPAIESCATLREEGRS